MAARYRAGAKAAATLHTAWYGGALHAVDAVYTLSHEHEPREHVADLS